MDFVDLLLDQLFPLKLELKLSMLELLNYQCIQSGRLVELLICFNINFCFLVFSINMENFLKKFSIND